jgi:hypothetical protein
MKKLINALKNETELPKIIDFLYKKGYIKKDTWRNSLDFFLIIDGLSYQGEILKDDLKLLYEIIIDLIKRFPDLILIFSFLLKEKISEGGK